MTEDEFWIEPCEADGHVAIVRATFNDFTVTISVERKNGGEISEAEAEKVYTEVIGLVPRRVRFRHGRDTTR